MPDQRFIIDGQTPQLLQLSQTQQLLEVARQGPAGPAGAGLPAGGVGGQYLRKGSAADYDASWAGAPGGDLSYVHAQAVPSASWVVVHNLGKYPSVSVVDSAGNEWIGDVHYDSANSLTVTFGAPFGGSAYLN